MARASIAVALLLWLLAAHAAESGTPGVLILYSNQRATPAQLIIEDTLRASLAATFQGPVQVFSEFLDDEWTSLEAYGAKQADFLRDKYERRNIRVMVVAALPTMRFAMQFRDRIVPGAPLVHMLVARDRFDGVKLPEDVLGVFEEHDPTPTLELALRLHPDTRRLVLIRGASDQDRRWDTRLRTAAQRLPRPVEIEYLAGLPTAEVLSRVATLPPGTVIYTPGYFVDGAGQVFTPRHVIERITAASAVPVYGTFDTFIGAGIVGGYMTRYEDQAKEVGSIIARLLSGTAPAALPSASVARVPMVDWRQLRRWNVDERELPPDAVVRFREPGAWDTHRVEISAGIAVVLVQAGLIAALLIQLRRRRGAERASTALAGWLLTAHEDERRRIARDLHDDVTQRLARLAIDASRLERNAHTESVDTAARAVREGLVSLSEDVHAISYRLHPSVLDDLGLAEGLRAECDRLSRQASIPVNVEVDDVPQKLPREPALCLFRVAQEALRNVIRHAQAKAIDVSLSARDRGLQLTVRDDGKGFDIKVDDRAPSLGQMSMRERVRLLGGRLRIVSAPGQGTTVTAWVPLEGAAS